MTNEKYCIRCKVNKLLTCFYKDKTRNDGYENKCKDNE